MNFVPLLEFDSDEHTCGDDGGDHFQFLPARPDGPRNLTPQAVVGVDSYGGPITRYEREKASGLRRSNGARKLKRLTNRHMEIITRHLAGESGDMIALHMRVTPVTVSRILNDPLAREIIAQVYDDRQTEIDALAGAAINTVRDALKGDHSIRTRMTAVDKFIKLKDSIGKQDESAQTAEDVIARIFKIEGSNVQINVGDRK